ncbi:MAG TPA: histidinol dehydrogenase [Desulfonauticus sp.]|nr:MAG: Histidinol dehydrogenase [Desulfonauticus sp. 38_4375]HCO11786.1 histidinol dehydrogenase [Desulfonauticus sp.]
MLINKFSLKQEFEFPQLKKWLSKRNESNLEIEDKVRRIIAQVKENKDQALLEYTRQFDCPDFSLTNLKVREEDLNKALKEIPAEDLDIIQEAKENIWNFHLKQKQNSWFTPQEDGTILGQIVNPVNKAGLYIPGGKGGETPLISSLLMNAIPALVAGVKEIHLVSPPRKNGSLNPYLLATAKILGLKDIYAVGSAWAIAALALGTETIPAVDIIVGPGNIFVTTAKKILQGQVGIDMIAGPSEITILADKKASPAYLAADLLSQAEHDPLAASILISPSPILLEAVEIELQRQLDNLSRKDIAAKSLQNWGALIEVPSIEQGLKLVNLIAPEHFEFIVDNPWDYLGQIKNAGAVFLGEYTPEPVGDYFAGPNHVLPTMSTARFAQALSVETFYKKTSLIYTPKHYIQRQGKKIARLARLEGLEAHARSVEIRLQN